MAGEMPADSGMVVEYLPPPPQEIQISDLGSAPETREARRDVVRERLSYIALGVFGVTVVLGFIGAIVGAEAWERTKEFLQIVVPVETLLIGGTSGHYFGNKT